MLVAGRLRHAVLIKVIGLEEDLPAASLGVVEMRKPL